jgi:hypothetical protein
MVPTGRSTGLRSTATRSWRSVTLSSNALFLEARFLSDDRLFLPCRHVDRPLLAVYLQLRRCRWRSRDPALRATRTADGLLVTAAAPNSSDQSAVKGGPLSFSS